MNILEFPNCPGRKLARRGAKRLPKTLPANVFMFNRRAASAHATAPSIRATSLPDPELIQACAHLHRMAERGAITGILFSLRTPKYKNGVWAAGDMVKPDAMKEAAASIYQAAYECGGQEK